MQLRNAAGAPADGEVVLESADAKRVASCTTSAATCEMPNVPGGSYKARVIPTVGKAPKPRSVLVPSSGRVSLFVNTEG